MPAGLAGVRVGVLSLAIFKEDGMGNKAKISNERSEVVVIVRHIHWNLCGTILLFTSLT
jgi:hypothetical protein